MIDDDPDLSQTLAGWLDRRGFESRVASSGEQGLKELEAGTFDLVLLDLVLPGMHGHAVLRALAARDDAPSVIVMSGTGTMDDVIDAMRQRAADYVRKPFHSEDLLCAIDRVLSQRATHDDAAARMARARPTESGQRFRAQLGQQVKERGAVGRRMAQIAVELTRGDLALPALDPRVTELLESLRGPREPSVQEVVRGLERDPALAAGILRRGNAPMVRPRGAAITRLDEACVRLGNRQVLLLITELLVGEGLDCDGPPFTELSLALRENAAATGWIARRLAPTLGVDPDEAHLAGLLHNLGELALLHLLSRRDWDAPPTPEALGYELSCSHERFGGVLARSWRLPEHVAALAGRHHRRPVGRESFKQGALRVLVVGAWALAMEAGYDYPTPAGAGREREDLRRAGVPTAVMDEAVRAACAWREADEPAVAAR